MHTYAAALIPPPLYAMRTQIPRPPLPLRTYFMDGPEWILLFSTFGVFNSRHSNVQAASANTDIHTKRSLFKSYM